MVIEFGTELFLILKERAIYHQRTGSLIISDMHIGKRMHFRKNGMAISGNGYEIEITKIKKLCLELNPKKIIISGDLFHSEENNEVTLFSAALFKIIKNVILVQGNHDILENRRYLELGYNIEQSYHLTDKIIILHDYDITNKKYQIVGHLHPGVRLEEKIGYSIQIACLAVIGKQMILPAFGNLTGKKQIDQNRAKRIIGFMGSGLIQIK